MSLAVQGEADTLANALVVVGYQYVKHGFHPPRCAAGLPLSPRKPRAKQPGLAFAGSGGVKAAWPDGRMLPSGNTDARTGQDGPMLTDTRFSRGLFAAFGAVAIAFVAATMLADWRTLSIDQETQTLLTDAMPSIEYLVAASDAVRDIEAAADDFPEVPVDQRLLARLKVDGLWKTVDAELDRYKKLPDFEEEQDLYRDVPSALRELDSAVRALFAEVEAGAVDKARIDADDKVRPRADKITGLLRRIVQRNAADAIESAHRITDQTRRATTIVSAGLDVVAVLLTLGSAIWLRRACFGPKTACSRLTRSWCSTGPTSSRCSAVASPTTCSPRCRR